jgi:hypothetical protein
MGCCQVSSLAIALPRQLGPACLRLLAADTREYNHQLRTVDVLAPQHAVFPSLSA